MSITLYIDDPSNPKVKAFLQFIKTLDFVRTEEDEKFELDAEHMRILEQRRKERLSGKQDFFSWEEVKQSAMAKIKKKSSR